MFYQLMKRISLLLLLCTIIFACKQGIPKDIIQPIEMENVLHDIHLIDGYVNGVAPQDSAKKVAAAYYKGTYKKFGIDSALYNQSLDYYYGRPDLMKTMYDHISDRLNKAKEAQRKADIKDQERIAKADSIKNAMLQKGLKDKSTVLKDSLKQKSRIDSLRKDSIRKPKSTVFLIKGR